MKFSKCILTIDNLKCLLKQLINYEIDLTKVISFPVLPFGHTLQTLLIPFFVLSLLPSSVSIVGKAEPVLCHCFNFTVSCTSSKSVFANSF